MEAEVDSEVEVGAESEGEGLMFSGDGICNEEASERQQNGNGVGTPHTQAFGNSMKQDKYDPFRIDSHMLGVLSTNNANREGMVH